MRTNWDLTIKLVWLLKRACWSWESSELQFLENYSLCPLMILQIVIDLLSNISVNKDLSTKENLFSFHIYIRSIVIQPPSSHFI